MKHTNPRKFASAPVSPLLPISQLDAQSPLPLNAQAEKWLQQLIELPPYRGGRLLPDEVTLSTHLGISRNTLRAAIDRLVQAGRLERKAGIGTWVVEPRVQSRISAWHSFTREMAAKGVTVVNLSSRVRQVTAPRAAASALRVEPGTPVLCLERLRGWDGEAQVHFLSYFPPRLGISLDTKFDRPLYEILRELTGREAIQSNEDLSAVPANRRLARLLSVRTGTALLRRERTVLDTGSQPLEFAVVHYRCDAFRLSLQLRQE